MEWAITNSPSGSNASFSGDVVVEKAGRVLHKEYLDLGDMPGDLMVEAACPDCTEGSPQTFTATAVCPEVPAYYQYDSRWAEEPYDKWCYLNDDTDQKETCDYNIDGTPKDGYTQFTIRKKGCALTSAVMVMNWYGYGSSGALDPPSLDDLMNSILMNSISKGYIKGAFNFGKLKDLTDPDLMVEVRNLNDGDNGALPKSELDGWLEMCIPVIVGVNNLGHWVVVTEKIGNDYAIKDPGYGKTLLSEYGNIYGYRALYNAKGVCAK